MEPDNDEGQRRRMYAATLHHAGSVGRQPTLDGLGAAVARREGVSVYAGSVVRRWLAGLARPRSLETWEALAAELGVDPGWLAFGERSQAPAPPAYAALPDVLPPLKTKAAPRKAAPVERSIAKARVKGAKERAAQKVTARGARKA